MVAAMTLLLHNLFPVLEMTELIPNDNPSFS